MSLLLFHFLYVWVRNSNVVSLIRLCMCSSTRVPPISNQIKAREKDFKECFFVEFIQYMYTCSFLVHILTRHESKWKIDVRLHRHLSFFSHENLIFVHSLFVSSLPHLIITQAFNFLKFVLELVLFFNGNNLTTTVVRVIYLLVNI